MAEKKNVPEIRFKGFDLEWEDSKLKNIVSSLTGGSSIKPEDYQDEGVRTIPKGAVNSSGVADLSGSKYISKDFFECNISSKVSTGNLVTSLRDLIPSAPNMGRIVRIEGAHEDFLMPQGVYKIELNDRTDENFIITYSNSNKYRKAVSKEKNGSTQVHIRNGEFLNFDIFIPLFNEQSRIGTYFQNLDKLITLHQRKYDKLVILKRAMLEKMFPKNGADVPEIRFKGFEGKWEERKLGETVIYIVDNRGRNPQYYFDSGIPIIDNFMIKNNSYPNLNEATRFIDDNLYRTFIRKYNEIDDVLITLVGNGIGNVTLFPNQLSVIIQNTLGLRFENNPKFMFYNLLSKNRLLKSLNRGMAQPSIRQDELLDINIRLPSIKEEQTKIGNYFQNLDNLISLHQRELEKLRNIKKACLEKMFV